MTQLTECRTRALDFLAMESPDGLVTIVGRDLVSHQVSPELYGLLFEPKPENGSQAPHQAKKAKRVKKRATKKATAAARIKAGARKGGRESGRRRSAKYTDDQRRKAKEVFLRTGSIQQAATETGVPYPTLWQWKKVEGWAPIAGRKGRPQKVDHPWRNQELGKKAKKKKTARQADPEAPGPLEGVDRRCQECDQRTNHDPCPHCGTPS